MFEERTCSAIPSASTSGRTRTEDKSDVVMSDGGREERRDPPGFGLVSHLISPPGLRKFDSLEEMIRPSNIKAKAPSLAERDILNAAQLGECKKQKTVRPRSNYQVSRILNRWGTCVSKCTFVCVTMQKEPSRSIQVSARGLCPSRPAALRTGKSLPRGSPPPAPPPFCLLACPLPFQKICRIEPLTCVAFPQVKLSKYLLKHG